MILQVRKGPQLTGDGLGTHLLRHRNAIRLHFPVGVVRPYPHIQPLGKRNQHKLYFAAAIATRNIERRLCC